MKAMKGLSMNKMLGSIKRRPTADRSDDATGASTGGVTADSSGKPEELAHRYVKLFCQSDGSSPTGDEVTYLPPIVESAESSPAAAAECARVLRKLLHRDYWSKPSYQYNAIMLMRILADNPGPTFTRNLDKKFVDTTKELLRGTRDASVHHILVETLETFEATKAYDEGLGPLIELWKKEKAKTHKEHGTWPVAMAPPVQQPFPQQNYFARNHSSRRTLPAPIDLANRLEEARTSAKLLEQVVACTPPDEVLSNDLIKEFAERCHTASQSIQGYMSVTDPTPDNDTMESLIDTNEQLQQALNQHQRAALNARKHLGLNVQSNQGSPRPGEDDATRRRGSRPTAQASSSRSNLDLPSLPDIGGGSSSSSKGKGKDKETEAWSAPGSSRAAANGKSRRTESVHSEDDDGDPFRDPVPEPKSLGKGLAGGSSSSSLAGRTGASSGGGAAGDPPRLAYEPFHPGFGSESNRDAEADGLHMAGGAGGGRATKVADADDEPGVEDAYRANPKNDPVYRY